MLVCARGALRYCRFQTVRRALWASAGIARYFLPGVDAGTIIEQVERSRRGLDRQTCLSVALTAEALLRQHGYDAELCLGAKREGGRFRAHAWIERGGAVVVGGPLELTAEYCRFPRIPVDL